MHEAFTLYLVRRRRDTEPGDSAAAMYAGWVHGQVNLQPPAPRPVESFFPAARAACWSGPPRDIEKRIVFDEPKRRVHPQSIYSKHEYTRLNGLCYADIKRKARTCAGTVVLPQQCECR